MLTGGEWACSKVPQCSTIDVRHVEVSKVSKEPCRIRRQTAIAICRRRTLPQHGTFQHAPLEA
jgi:hypothetical protein